jgi:hypothetical protein
MRKPVPLGSTKRKHGLPLNRSIKASTELRLAPQQLHSIACGRFELRLIWSFLTALPIAGAGTIW